MKYYNTLLFNSFYRDKILRINAIFCFLLNLILWIGLFWQSRLFTESMPLHYNIYFGVDLYGPWYRIFLIPAVGLAVILINFTIGSFLYAKEKMLSYFLAGTASFIQLIVFLATFAIIYVNL